MKTIPFIALFFVMIFTSSYVSTKIDAQTETQVNAGTFKQFSVQSQGTGVVLNWSVSNSNIVEFGIERSYDGAYFETIGSCPCNGTSVHRYTDASANAGVIYYRITAIKADKSVETSTAESVHYAKRS